MNKVFLLSILLFLFISLCPKCVQADETYSDSSSSNSSSNDFSQSDLLYKTGEISGNIVYDGYINFGDSTIEGGAVIMEGTSLVSNDSSSSDFSSGTFDQTQLNSANSNDTAQFDNYSNANDSNTDNSNTILCNNTEISSDNITVSDNNNSESINSLTCSNKDSTDSNQDANDNAENTTESDSSTDSSHETNDDADNSTESDNSTDSNKDTNVDADNSTEYYNSSDLSNDINSDSDNESNKSDNNSSNIADGSSNFSACPYAGQPVDCQKAILLNRQTNRGLRDSGVRLVSSGGFLAQEYCESDVSIDDLVSPKWQTWCLLGSHDAGFIIQNQANYLYLSVSDEGEVITSSKRFVWEVAPVEFNDPSYVGYVQIIHRSCNGLQALSTNTTDWLDIRVFLDNLRDATDYNLPSQQWNIHLA